LPGEGFYEKNCWKNPFFQNFLMIDFLSSGMFFELKKLQQALTYKIVHMTLSIIKMRPLTNTKKMDQHGELVTVFVTILLQNGLIDFNEILYIHSVGL
jgi:hypothetical protein